MIFWSHKRLFAKNQKNYINRTIKHADFDDLNIPKQLKAKSWLKNCRDCAPVMLLPNVDSVEKIHVTLIVHSSDTAVLGTDFNCIVQMCYNTQSKVKLYLKDQVEDEKNVYVGPAPPTLLSKQSLYVVLKND